MVVVPGDGVVAGLGDEAVAVLQPLPRGVGRGEHVVGAVGHVARRTSSNMSAPIAVGAEDHRVGTAGRRRVPDPVVHVAARVVGDRAREVAIEVHAVDDQPVVGGQRFQPLAGGRVRGALGDVHVHADAQVAGQSCCGVERLVAAGERGVDADHPATTGADEALVLGQTTAGAVGTVAVGDPVRAHDAHPHLGARLRDHVEAALDGVRALVVVDDRGRPTHQGLRGPEHRRPAQHVQVERGVQPPPDLLEDRREVGRLLRRRGHAAGERRVEVVVAADQPRRRGGHQSSEPAPLPDGRIGRTVRHWPSTACNAAATAPDVGTRPISPTPLMP